MTMEFTQFKKLTFVTVIFSLLAACGKGFEVKTDAPPGVTPVLAAGSIVSPTTSGTPPSTLLTPLPRPVPSTGSLATPLPRPVPYLVQPPLPLPATPAPSTPSQTSTVPTPGTLSGLTDSGPITLESNHTYANLRITNPSGRCVYGYNVTNVRITNSEIGPCGDGSNSDQVGIMIHTSTNVRVDHNLVHDVATGIVGVSSTGVVFDHNYVSSVRGPGPSGQAFLFDSMQGAGNKILCNIGANTDQDGTEDNLNTWKSHGTADSYIEIAFNRISGGHSKTGTGINAGDGEGSYIDIHDNTIMNVNNAGIAISSGDHMKIRNNKIYNNGTYSSVGISVRNWYAGCSDIDVSNNRVWAFDHLWGMNSEWDYLNTHECTNVTESGNTFGDTSLSPAIFGESYSPCGSF
jgi:hypothetical protein